MMEDAKVEQVESKETPETTAKPVTIAVSLRPQVGRMYSVRRLDGQWLPAEVLEKRELKGKATEYFVHFENSDKRLDEWICLERVDLEKGEIVAKADAEQSSEMSERKITRNQKRKNDMISNVIENVSWLLEHV